MFVLTITLHSERKFRLWENMLCCQKGHFAAMNPDYTAEGLCMQPGKALRGVPGLLDAEIDGTRTQAAYFLLFLRLGVLLPSPDRPSATLNFWLQRSEALCLEGFCCRSLASACYSAVFDSRLPRLGFCHNESSSPMRASIISYRRFW